MAARPKALGVHIYSGSQTIGVMRNFDVVAQLEELDAGAATFELNFPEIPHPLRKEEWEHYLDKHTGNVDLVYANPTCAIWSVLGSHKGTDDPRVAFTKNSMEVGLRLQPSVFVLESVCRAWSSGHEYYRMWAEEFAKHGYATTILMTNAILHGAPQHRERFHFIAHRPRLRLKEPTVPIPVVPTVELIIGDLERNAQWLGDRPLYLPNHEVKRPNELEAATLAELKQGEGWSKAVDRLRARGIPAKNGRIISQRLHWKAPAGTMVDIGCVYHPTQDRLLTIREGARLCGYPDDFVFATDTRNKEFNVKPSDLTQVVLPQMGDYLSAVALASLEEPDAEPGDLEVVDWRHLAKQYRAKKYLTEGVA